MLESKFKGLSDIALGEAKRLGCTLRRRPLHAQRQRRVGVRDRIVTGGGGFGGGWRPARRAPALASASSTAASGALPAARSSPKTRSSKITAQAIEVAKASAVSKRFEVKLAPTPSLRRTTGRCRSRSIPITVSLDDKIAFLMKINEAALKQPDVMRVQSQIALRLRVEVPGHVRRLVHRAGDLADGPELQRDRAQGQRR